MTMPIDSYGRAIAAYSRAANADASPAADEAEAPSGRSFADFLDRTVERGMAAGRAAEKASVNAVSGGADLSQVVSAVVEAETTLQTVVAVRERIIDAYKEIMRMPI
jgi:flagellar hook-basal body complex protein FliE